jgi:hypothetical protein
VAQLNVRLNEERLVALRRHALHRALVTVRLGRIGPRTSAMVARGLRQLFGL